MVFRASDHHTAPVDITSMHRRERREEKARVFSKLFSRPLESLGEEIPEDAAMLLRAFTPYIEMREEESVAITKRPSRAAATELMREAGEMLAEINRLEQKYAKEPPAGAIVAFQRSYPGNPQVYSYSGIRGSDNMWYLTGTAGHTPVSWMDLLGFLDDGAVTNFSVVSTDPFGSRTLEATPDEPGSFTDDDDAPGHGSSYEEL
jgi:hypothetical protein